MYYFSFQNLLCLDTNRCPIDDCNVTVGNEASMVRHYGVDHLRSVSLLASGKDVLTEQQKDLIGAMKKALNFESVSCSGDKERAVCAADFGSKIGWLHHLSTSHYYKKLLCLYKTHSAEMKSSEHVSAHLSTILFVVQAFTTCPRWFDQHY